MTPGAVLVFAAGFGTRMRPLTDTVPEPLIAVGGRTLLDHALDLARQAGPLRIVVNAHYLAEQIAAHLHGTDVAVSVETPEILDTGGGLRQALPLLGPGPVFTLNADMVWSGPNPLMLLAQAWRPGALDASLLCVPLTQTVGRAPPGDFAMDGAGTIRRGGDWVYTGAQIIDPALIAAIPDRVFSLNRAWDLAAARGRLGGVAYPGRWADVGRPQGIAEAERMLADV